MARPDGQLSGRRRGRRAPAAAVVLAALAACASLPDDLPGSARGVGERLAPPPVVDELRLAVFGDWGTGDAWQWALIDSLERTAGRIGGFHAGILLGDNFYPHGVEGVDDPLWDAFFSRPFDTPRLGRLTWYAVPGNHDYRGDVQAQIDYTLESGGRWSMPSHYYRVDLGPEGATPLLTVLALDTATRFDDWDGQLAWLDGELAGLALAGRTTIVVGHHPVISYSRHGKGRGRLEDLAEVLARRRPTAYLAGHDHNLQLIEQDGVGYAVLGSGVRSLYQTRRGEGSRFALAERGFGVLRVTAAGLALEFHDLRGGIPYTWRAPAKEASDRLIREPGGAFPGPPAATTRRDGSAAR